MLRLLCTYMLVRVGVGYVTVFWWVLYESSSRGRTGKYLRVPSGGLDVAGSHVGVGTSRTRLVDRLV